MEIYYIKLGAGSDLVQSERGKKVSFEKYCIDNGFLYFGFGSQSYIDEINSGNYENFDKSFTKESTKHYKTRAKNVARLFFECSPQDIWITFHEQKMYWTTISSKAFLDQSTNSTMRRADGGWKCFSQNGEIELIKDKLPGNISKISGYRGTICSTGNDKDTVLRVINGDYSEQSSDAQKALNEILTHLPEAVKKLGPKDFEILVDLVLLANGCRRISSVGGTEKFSDGRYQLDVLNVEIVVQVKTSTSFAKFEKYVTEYKNYSGRRSDDTTADFNIAQMTELFFYIYNQSDDEEKIEENAAIIPNLKVIGPKRFSEMVLSAGLFDWVILHAR